MVYMLTQIQCNIYSKMPPEVQHLHLKKVLIISFNRNL
jgi:hypothetical protein